MVSCALGEEMAPSRWIQKILVAEMAGAESGGFLRKVPAVGKESAAASLPVDLSACLKATWSGEAEAGGPE